MKKKKYYLVLAIAVVFIGGTVLWSFNRPQKAEAPAVSDSMDSSKAVYYYGQDCPHCRNVEKFLQDNKISEKFGYIEKEVQYDKDNASEFMKRAKECGLSESQMGVPLVYFQGKCHSGEIEVMDFFKSQAGI